MEQSSNQATDTPQPNPIEDLTPAERLARARQRLTSSRTYLQIGRTSVVVRDDVLGDISKEEASRVNIVGEPSQSAQHAGMSATSPEKPLVDDHSPTSAGQKGLDNHTPTSAEQKGLENHSPQEGSEPTAAVEKKSAPRGRKKRRDEVYDPTELRKKLPGLVTLINEALAKEPRNSTPSEPGPSVPDKKRRRPRPSGSKRLPPRQEEKSSPTSTSSPEAGPSTRSRTKLLREAAAKLPSSEPDLFNDSFGDGHEEMEEDLRRILSPPITYPLYNGFYNTSPEPDADHSQEKSEEATNDGVDNTTKELQVVTTPSSADSQEETETSVEVDTKATTAEIFGPEQIIDDVFSPSVSSTSTPKRAKEEIEYTIPTLPIPTTPPSDEMVYLACVTRGKPLQRQYAMLNVLEGLEESKKPGAFSAFIAGFKLMFGTASVSNAIVAGAQAVVSGIQNLFGYERSSLKRTREEEEERQEPAAALPITRTLPEEQDPETPRRKRARLSEEPVSVSPRKRSSAPSPPAERPSDEFLAPVAPSVLPDSASNLQVAIARPRKKVDRLSGVYRQGEVPYLPQSQDSGASSSGTTSPVRARATSSGTRSPGVRRSPRKHARSQPARGA
ncbi:hypothetical protein JR316_0012249 [Psilocybe cubensis]|uniref:Uncharacterized protein n=2 Tax=Psilocybe cubensis TaxID=181762 RepID=A0ACB8GHV4_PSICU|nr:hypothetical protein JR316_0012249 [Psilocybe cubensis]KAH9475138.1 hypothetical protein JR316_0012249 [Psilocybe cubensis]